MTFKRFVTVLEVIAGVAALVFVIALFTNEPDDGSAGGAPESAGASLYGESCASCHGQDGGGGVGPQLAGTVVEELPDPADEIKVVTDGRRGMPAFGGRLTEAEIAQIVEYTRTDLGS